MLLFYFQDPRPLPDSKETTKNSAVKIITRFFFLFQYKTLERLKITQLYNKYGFSQLLLKFIIQGSIYRMNIHVQSSKNMNTASERLDIANKVKAGVMECQHTAEQSIPSQALHKPKP